MRLDDGSRMTRECHVRICERLEVKLLRPTRHFGMKAHVGVDSKTKLIHTALVSAANVVDAIMLPELLHGEETRVWGDQAYRGQADVIHRCAPQARDCTHRRYRYKDWTDEVEREKNRSKSTVRSKVEHVFALMKLQFGFVKVRYRGLVRIAYRTYLPTKWAGERLRSSGLSKSVKIDLIMAHLFLHPCSRCKKSVRELSPNDESLCIRCQFSLKHRWQELASVAPRVPKVGATEPCHELQLYSTEEGFLQRFTRFIGTALSAGDAVVAVATKSHRDALFQRLLGDGLDVASAMDQGRYIPLDVSDTLSTFMVNDVPDPVRFSQSASSLFSAAKKAARGKHPRVAACGECAPLLWQEGKADAAIRLEELWDDIAKAESVDILCGYPGSSFHCEHGSETLQRILAGHSALHAG
jgi:hypothetical protein